MSTDCQFILESLSEGVIQLDTDGYIQYINPAVTRLTGYSDKELLNKPYAILKNITDTTESDYELEKASKTGQFISEGWRSRKSGEKFWSVLNISPIYNEQNKINGFSCVLHDESVKKQFELKLRRSEEQFRLIVDSIRDYSIFMLDPKGNILTWNEGGTKIHGYMRDEILGKHFSIFYTPDSQINRKPDQELEIAMGKGEFQEEGWRLKKNGSPFWASVVITPLFNERNVHIGFSKITHDLTEKKNYEEALKHSEERFRSLVEQVLDYGIFMMDDKGRIISWNEGARRIKGYEANEIIGKYFTIFYPEEEIVKGKPVMELEVARKEGKYEEEGWRLRKNGQRFWANVLITAVYNSEGNHIGFSKVTRDLTERKESERALKESYQSYRMLANELKTINDELTYANQELEQFTSIVSHDLQEPIRTIKSFLQLIEMKIDPLQQEDLNLYISKSIHAANRMKELILNLLQYSQLSRNEVIDEDVDVNELFNQVTQNLKSSIEESNGKIFFETTLKTIRGNRVQLQQLLQNLLSNSLKFMDKNNPLIKVVCTKEHNEVKFSVSDNGIGIHEQDNNKVFEIFRRLNTRKEYPGTGIGLAICKKIVDQHGGKIWPESEPGKGTTFYFTLNENKARHLHHNEKI